MSKNLQNIKVSLNHNGTILVEFFPSEDKWAFPNGKKLKLFNILHAIITPQHTNFDEEDNLDFDEAVARGFEKNSDKINNIERKIREIIIDWIDKGDLVIE